MTNQTALHALPAAINALSNALLATIGGGHISVTNLPLPTLHNEQSAEVAGVAGKSFGDCASVHVCVQMCVCVLI